MPAACPQRFCPHGCPCSCLPSNSMPAQKSLIMFMPAVCSQARMLMTMRCRRSRRLHRYLWSCSCLLFVQNSYTLMRRHGCSRSCSPWYCVLAQMSMVMCIAALSAREPTHAHAHAPKSRRLGSRGFKNRRMPNLEPRCSKDHQTSPS